ncbi:hypothetical protein [Pseudomonas aeruginosa]|jgi:hypothetical protein|uniref:hypothetical protein n=1 Tax=Pseudomonas aeruginosa TaxID=287 RepID=UPI001E1383DF|nr:hypothetical protein [Pseudomonas aeruginosa]MBN0172553.1 hypothetical protein [Pseudomonas aeruginosa]MBX6882334.1 hypothetical protein [Pseudomonas aeruginosa]MBX6932716.1 hypothetical protein [Pseudomonas aeruginosa]MCZ9867137.1 hypothetical protein [Pseudomonas aeruginosa]MCZ9906461.1 hypothetical protein [Pseudomonas aeruginosa]
MRSPEQARRREVRVTFEGGKTLETAINGTEEEIVRYYKDNSFNVGVADNDDMQAVTSVEFIDAQPGMS